MTREPRVIYDLLYKSTNYDGGYHVIGRFYHYGVLFNRGEFKKIGWNRKYAKEALNQAYLMVKLLR